MNAAIMLAGKAMSASRLLQPTQNHRGPEILSIHRLGNKRSRAMESVEGMTSPVSTPKKLPPTSQARVARLLAVSESAPAGQDQRQTFSLRVAPAVDVVLLAECGLGPCSD